ncbi:MAG: PAS domain S-box protein, partial [Candidatus Lokiarchaeota archaeon]|nr:PAS domain S-box protein [Candidatus Lokiarchaeota archaeon]
YYISMFKNHIKYGRALKDDAVIITKSGKRKNVHITASITQVNGKSILQGIFRDIHERIEMENKLKDTKARYKAIFDRTLNAVYIHDFDGNFIDANEKALDLLGYSREDIPNINIETLLDKDQLPIALSSFKNIIKRIKQKNLTQYKLKRKDGNYIWVETEGSLILKHGKPFAILGIARDITERRKMHELYKSIFELSPDSILTIDKNGMITAANDAAVKMYGYSKEEMIGRHFSWIFPLKDIPEYIEAFSSTFKGKNKSLEFTSFRKDGSTFLAEVRVRLLKVDDELIGLLAISRDITKLKTTK